MMRALTIAPLVCLMSALGPARTAAQRELELSVGASSLLLLSTFSGGVYHAVDATARVAMTPAWGVGGGVRLGLTAAEPELFGRVDIQRRIRDWAPSAGLELGVTTRGNQRSDDPLLAELREQSLQARSPYYIAINAALLRFHVFERYRVSALEFQLGTHLEPLGGHVRLQLGLLSVGVAL